MNETLKVLVIWAVKLGVISYVVLTFIEADISVKILLIYLAYMVLERGSELSKLSDKVDIQTERIDELEDQIRRK